MGASRTGKTGQAGKSKKAPPPPGRSMIELLILELRVLTFTASPEELLSIGKREYFFGLGLVWLAGMGRYWHDLHANWVSKTGFSGICYVVLLGTFLWILFALVGARNLKFGRLIIFICMTAPPALLYALPVEMVVPAFYAEWTNILSLLFVSIWRVALLVWFIRKTTELSPMRTGVAVFLPLSCIICITALSGAVVSIFSQKGGTARELRKIKTTSGQFDSGGSPFNMTGPPQLAGAGPFSTPAQTNPSAYSTPADINNPYSTPAPITNPSAQQQPANRGHGRRVTESTTGWLTNQGHELAEQPDSPAGRLKLGGPMYVETIATPDGPVEVYTDVSIGLPGLPATGSRVPPGFEEIPKNDPVYSYRHPLANLLTPVAVISAVAFVPAFITYFVFMCWRPKKEEEEEEDDDDDIEEDDDAE